MPTEGINENLCSEWKIGILFIKIGSKEEEEEERARDKTCTVI